jgi:hypothetical protein
MNARLVVGHSTNPGELVLDPFPPDLRRTLAPAGRLVVEVLYVREPE